MQVHTNDLVPSGLDVLEVLLVDHTVQEDEVLAVFDVQVPQGCKLLDASDVQEWQHQWRGIHLDLFVVEVLNIGSYFWMKVLVLTNCSVRADLPTLQEPSTTMICIYLLLCSLCGMWSSLLEAVYKLWFV